MQTFNIHAAVLIVSVLRWPFCGRAVRGARRLPRHDAFRICDLVTSGISDNPLGL